MGIEFSKRNELNPKKEIPGREFRVYHQGGDFFPGGVFGVYWREKVGSFAGGGGTLCYEKW